METRKIIKFGKNSFIVSLPKEWMVQHRLQKGSELHVETKPGAVEFSVAAVEPKEWTGRIDCKNKSISSLETELSCLYKRGCNTIVVEGEYLPEKVNEVRERLLKLAGMEIVEQDLHKIVVKDLIDIKQIMLPTLINRMDMMVRSMFQDTVSKEAVPSKVLHDRDKDVNRLQLLVARMMRIVFDNPNMAKTLKISVRMAHYYARIAWALERIADYVKRANGDMEASGKAARKRLKEFLNFVFQKYLATIKFYYKRDEKKAFELHEEIVGHLSVYTKHIYEAKETTEVLALENIKNVLRDLRIILRITAEINALEGEKA